MRYCQKRGQGPNTKILAADENIIIIQHGEGGFIFTSCLALVLIHWLIGNTFLLVKVGGSWDLNTFSIVYTSEVQRKWFLSVLFSTHLQQRPLSLYLIVGGPRDSIFRASTSPRFIQHGYDARLYQHCQGKSLLSNNRPFPKSFGHSIRYPVSSPRT